MHIDDLPLKAAPDHGAASRQALIRTIQPAPRHVPTYAAGVLTGLLLATAVIGAVGMVVL